MPKILIDELSVRTPVREPQLAEQLVEVPTIISFSSLQRIVEQNVDIPVPYGGARGLQGFPFGQDSTSSPLSLERISERNVEQIVDSRGFGGGLQDFLRGQSSSSPSHDPARVHEALDGSSAGVFRTFPQNKKSATVGPHSSLRVPASVISRTGAASSDGSSAAPAAPAEPFPRWVFEVVNKGCVDTRPQRQLVDQERRGGVG